MENMNKNVNPTVDASCWYSSGHIKVGIPWFNSHYIHNTLFRTIKQIMLNCGICETINTYFYQNFYLDQINYRNQEMKSLP